MLGRYTSDREMENATGKDLGIRLSKPCGFVCFALHYLIFILLLGLLLSFIFYFLIKNLQIVVLTKIIYGPLVGSRED